MAYMFSKIQNLVNQKSEQPGGSNIFEKSADQPAAEAIPQAAPLTKTNIAGDVGQTGASSGDTVKSNQTYRAADTDALRANIGKTDRSSPFKNIQRQVQQNQQRLQDQADQYTQNYKDQYQFDRTNEALDSAIQGGAGSDNYRDTSQFLARSNIDPVNQFEGAEDYRVNDLQYLRNDAGLGYLAGRGQGPQYTQGMSAFDVMLMRRDPQFNALINQIRGQGAELDRSISDKPDALESAAQDYGQSALESAQQSAREYITGYGDQLRAQNEAEADEYEAARALLDQDEIRQSQIDDIGRGVRESYESLDRGERYDQQIRDALADYDPTDRILFDQTDYGYKDFLDSGEANELTNIGGLLGSGEAYTSAMTPTEADYYTVDRSNIEADLQQDIDTRRQMQDLVSQSEIEKILEAAAQRGRDIETNRRRLIPAYQQALEDYAKEYAGNLSSQYGDIIINPDVATNPLIDPIERRDATQYSFLTAQDVADLEALQSDLGFDKDYSVGQGNELYGDLPDFNLDNKELSESDIAELEKYITGQNQQNIDAYNELQDAIKANDEARIAAGAEALNALGAEFKDPLGLSSRLSAPTWLERRMPRINPPKIVLPNIKIPHIEAPKGWEFKW